MRTGRPLVMVVLAALGVGLFAWSGTVTAHDRGYNSKVTIHHPNSFTWTGRVKSFKAACERDRRVKLYRSTDDTYTGFYTFSDDEGRWRIELIGVPYYAKVKRKVLTPGGHRHVCRGDTSPPAEDPPTP